jgi:hypothetical protein
MVQVVSKPFVQPYLIPTLKEPPLNSPQPIFESVPGQLTSGIANDEYFCLNCDAKNAWNRLIEARWIARITKRKFRDYQSFTWLVPSSVCSNRPTHKLVA